jgi:hypothetical protein
MESLDKVAASSLDASDVRTVLDNFCDFGQRDF